MGVTLLFYCTVSNANEFFYDLTMTTNDYKLPVALNIHVYLQHVCLCTYIHVHVYDRLLGYTADKHVLISVILVQAPRDCSRDRKLMWTDFAEKS